MDYLGECYTIEELSLKRNTVLSEINKEFAEKRKILSERVPEFKQIPFMELPIITAETPIYNFLPFIEGKVASNILKIEAGRQVLI